MSIDHAMRTYAPAELTSERERVEVQLQEMRAKWGRDRFIPAHERLDLEPLLRQRLAEIDQQRWESVLFELKDNRVYLTHLPSEPSLARCPVEPEHYANLILIGPSEKGVRREGVEFLAPGETGLSLYGQFLKSVLIHSGSLQAEQNARVILRPTG